MEESFSKANETASDGLGQELSRMFDEDQTMRLSGTWDIEVGKRNTARMKEIVATFGWPTISKYGEQAAHAAWLLVQHADEDPQFQEKVLALMKDLPEEVSKQDVAYLEDRVRVNTGRPTLYGTQFYNDSITIRKGYSSHNQSKIEAHWTSDARQSDSAPLLNMKKKYEKSTEYVRNVCE